MLKIKAYITTAALILTVILAACECVPDIDTDKIIEPEDPAKILFVHAMPDMGKVSLESKNKLLGDYSYNDTEYRYKGIASNSNILKILNSSDDVIYTRSVEFTKNHFYTFIAYGFGSRVLELALPDTISNYSRASSYIRYTNVSIGAPGVDITLNKTDYDINTLEYRSFTPFEEISPGSYMVEVKNANNDSLLINKEIEIIHGRIYTLIIRGFFSDNSSKGLECHVVGAEYVSEDDKQ